MTDGFDVVIVGSGVGGGCIAHVLAPAGARIAILERGSRLERDARNWDPEAVYADAVYKSDERWFDGSGRAFRPGQFYHVGGHTKVFGATMFRFRREDFSAMEHAGGLSPAWPIDYDTLEPCYARAERLFGVHGEAGRRPDGAAALGSLPASAAPPQSGDCRGGRALARPAFAPVPAPFVGAGSRRRRVRALQHLRRFPLPAWRQGRRGDPADRPGAAARERGVANRRRRWSACVRTPTGRRVVAAEMLDGTAVQGDLFVLAAGGGQQRRDPASLGPCEAPQGPRQRVGHGRAPLHEPQLHGGDGHQAAQGQP